MKRKIIKKEISDLTFGWLGTVVDLALVSLVSSLALNGAAYSKNRSSFKIIADAGRMFKTIRGNRLQKSLRLGLYQLADRGFRDQWQVTNEGYRRLKEIVPKYIPLNERQWDGFVYLIYYDIPENLKRSRQRLSSLLKKLAYGQIQESVWVSLDDPEDMIKDVVDWDELDDFVIVSKIAPDGYLRSNNVKPLFEKAFRIKIINQRYQYFINEYNTDIRPPIELVLIFLGILKTDPQLPAPFLPKEWKGDVAFLIYKNKIISKLPHKDEQLMNKLFLGL